MNGMVVMFKTIVMTTCVAILASAMATVNAADSAPASGPAGRVVAVRPGESIQAAIDSLPTEGGTVELAEGTWTLTSTVRIINRNNVTLRGAGIGKTTLTTSQKDMCLIIASPLENNDFLVNEKNGGAAQQDPRLNKAPFCHNVNLRNISLIGPGTRHVKGVANAYGILYAKIANSVIANVEANKLHNGIALYRCNDNTLDGLKIVQNDFFMLFFSVGVNNMIKNCLFEGGTRWYAIDFNGHCKRNKVVGNAFKTNGQGDLKIYSGSEHNAIIGNLFDGGGKCDLGITIMNGSWNLIQGNVFTGHNSRSKDCAAVVQRKGGGDRSPEFYNHDNRILNNVFYANKAGNAVLCVAGTPPEVRHNIIAKTKGRAITGIHADQCSYNDLWENAGGNDSGGTGSISADPLFADPAGEDFHLKSKTGRWDAKAKSWVKDNVHSPGIDAGDPKADFSKEPSPNGGRINLGAYGNTSEASKSLKN